MAKKLFHWGSRTTRLFLEGIAVLFGLVVLGILLLGWRLASGPVDISFANDYIEQGLYDPASGYRFEIGDVSLAWPDLRSPLTLELKAVSITDDKTTILTVDGVSLGLAGRALLTGQIAPVSIALTEPALRLIRDEKNNISLNLETRQQDPEELGNNVFQDILAALGPERDKSSPLSLLQNVEITNASMIVEDHTLGISWFLRQLDILLIREESGLLTTVSLDLPGGRDKAANIQAEAVYLFDQTGTWIDLHIQDFDPRIIARKVPDIELIAEQELYLNGDISLQLDSDMTLRDIRVSLLAKEGQLTIDSLYDAPLPYDEITLKARYDLTRGLAEIETFSILAQDVLAKISGTSSVNEEMADARLTLEIPNLPQSEIAHFWPDKVEQASLRTWLVDNLSEGALTDVIMNAGIAAAKNPETGWGGALNALSASFNIDNMTVDYRAPLTPARNVTGPGSYSYETDTLEIGVDSATVGVLNVSGGAVSISKVAGEGVGEASILLDIDGPLPAVFDYIALEPIGMTGSELGLDTGNIKGNADFEVSVKFPTLRDLPADEVNVDVAGTLKKLVLPDVVKSFDLSGEALSIAVGDGLASLKGNGMLEGRPVTFSWQQYLESKGKPFSSQIVASLNADSGLRQELGIDLSDWLEGSLPVDVTYTEYGNGKAEALVSADLKPAILKVTPFDYRKPAGVGGKARATTKLNNGLVEEISGLTVETPALKLEKGQLLFENIKGSSELKRGEIPHFILKESDFALQFEQKTNGTLQIAAKGAFLDARPFLNRDKKDRNSSYSGPPLVVTLDVGRMRTEDTRLISDTKLFLKLNRVGMLDHIEMDAFAGKGAIYLRLKPDDTGRMALRFEADDAGATLRSFGIYENVVGGKIVIYGEAASPETNRLLNGVMQISDFRIKDAPILAQLLGATSPTGLPQLLSGEGLSFARLESGFDWYMRPEGDLYILKDGRTSGSSLGLTFEGAIDKAKNMVDVSGQVVPMAEINRFIGHIPIIGAILSGGDNSAIFAATYSISGPAEELTVFVNPLAVLTPGIIRKILFEDGLN